MQFTHGFKLIFPADLTVNNAMPMILPEGGIQGLSESVQDLIETLVSDRMNSDLHAFIMGIRDHLLQLLITKQGIAAGRWIILIGNRKMGSPAAKRTIGNDLQRTYPEPVISFACKIAFFNKRFQLLIIGKVALFINPHRELSFILQFLESFIDDFSRNLTEGTVVIALYAGYSKLI